MSTIPLAPVDYLFTGICSQPISFAFFYPQRLHTEKVRHSLDTAAEQFPLLRCVLTAVSDHELAFRYDRSVMTMSVRTSDREFSTDDRIDAYVEPIRTAVDEPLSRLSMTHTPGGSVLAVSISHALVDGFSYFHFLSSWARLTRGDRFIPPNTDRNSMSARITAAGHAGAAGTNSTADSLYTDRLYTDCGLFLGTDREPVHPSRSSVHRQFISENDLKKYADEALKKHGLPVSHGDLISAIIWKTCVPAWTNLESSDRVYITNPFDFRRVLTGFPKNYFGCALCFATAETTAHELKHATVAEIALQIKRAVGGIRDTYILRSLAALDTFRMEYGYESMQRIHLRHPETGMIATNLSRMPLGDLDFGSGLPASFIAFAETDRSAAILPAPGGVDVLVCRPNDYPGGSAPAGS